MCLKLRVSIWRRYTDVRSLQCQTSVSQPLVSTDSLHHELDSASCHTVLFLSEATLMAAHAANI